MKSQPILTFFMGNTVTINKLTEYKSDNKANSEEIKKIFEKICSSPNPKEQRTKIGSKLGNYYFTMLNPNMFYLVLAEGNYPERHVFELIDEVHNDGLYNMVEGDELSKDGRVLLKNKIEKYQDLKNINNIASAQNDIEDIKIDMKTNIRNITKNIDDVSELEDQSKRIKLNSELYKNDANDLKKVTWWQNCKLTLIIIGIVVVLCLIIFIPIITR